MKVRMVDIINMKVKLMEVDEETLDDTPPSSLLDPKRVQLY
jgi:hypothetical protein